MLQAIFHFQRTCNANQGLETVSVTSTCILACIQSSWRKDTRAACTWAKLRCVATIKKKISQKVYKVRQHETVMFNLCLRLSTFNDVLRCSSGRKTHISMQMRRQTQTSVLVLWITTYQTQTRRPDY